MRIWTEYNVFININNKRWNRNENSKPLGHKSNKHIYRTDGEPRFSYQLASNFNHHTRTNPINLIATDRSIGARLYADKLWMQFDTIRVHCWRCVFNYHAHWVSTTSISLINLYNLNSIRVIAFCSVLHGILFIFNFSFIVFVFVIFIRFCSISLFRPSFEMISIGPNFVLFSQFICSMLLFIRI